MVSPPVSKGLGDTIAKVTNAIGIKPCSACKKRQELLNKVFPYRNSGKAVEVSKVSTGFRPYPRSDSQT